MSNVDAPNVTSEVDQIVAAAQDKIQTTKAEAKAGLNRVLGEDRPKSIYLVNAEVDSLLYWRNKVVSGVVFSAGILFYLLINVFDYTVLSLAAWASCALMLASVLFVVGSGLNTRFRGAAALDYNRTNWPLASFRIKQDDVTAAVHNMVATLNVTIAHLKHIFYAQDIVLTLKAAGAAAAVGYFASFFNFITILFLVFFLGFTVPLTYQTYQPQIDAAWDKVLMKTKETTRVVLEKFPRTPAKGQRKAE